MAFSNVKVFFEIGHESSVRNKRTMEGFTHDWEVFVRGADNTDISHFVEKVVFHLHDTFSNPDRVVKEPPYSVKERGYAGFNLPIDIYFKNLDEPKQVQYEYDLQLQTSGPSIIKTRREKFTFPNPPEDLRRRLIRGGGVGTSDNDGIRFAPPSDKSLDDVSRLKATAPLVGKPKLGGDSSSKKLKSKDYKTDEPPRGNDEFSDLFGTPIHTNSKASPDSKKSSSSKTVEKHSSGGKSKRIPQKEVKDKGSLKDEGKERSKDKEKSKDKSQKHVSVPVKRPQSPKRHGTPPKQSVGVTNSSKRPASPHKRPVTPQLKDDAKKKTDESKGKNDSKSTDSKSEKRKKDKKNSKEEKSKKEKLKGHDKKHEELLDVTHVTEKSSKEKEKKITETKEVSHKELEKLSGKHTDGVKEHDKIKHKHKKKEKNKSDDGEKDKNNDRGKASKKGLEKLDEVKDKEKNGVSMELFDGSKKKGHSHESVSPPRPNTSPAKPPAIPDKLTATKEKPAKRPLKMLLAELTDHESSDSNNSPSSEEEDSFEPHVAVLSKKLPKTTDDARLSSAAKATQSIENVVNSYERSPVNSKAHSKSLAPVSSSFGAEKQNDKPKNKSDTKKKKDKKEPKSKSGSKEKDKGEKEPMKRKRKSSEMDEGMINYELSKKNMREEMETVLVDDAPTVTKSEPVEGEVGKSQYATDVTKAIGIVQPVQSGGGDRFTADYVAELKDLQHKIMTLESNTELQRVVQLIAETGHYEITKKTFDFDLCELDQMTVKRLQDFFVAS